MSRNLWRECNLALRRILLKAEPDRINEHIDGLSVSLQEYWKAEAGRIFGAAIYQYENGTEESKGSKAALAALLLLLFGRMGRINNEQSNDLSTEVKRRVSNSYVLGAYDSQTYENFMQRGILVVTPGTRKIHDAVFWGMAGAYQPLLQERAEKAITAYERPDDIHSALLSTLKEDDFEYWRGMSIQAVVKARAFGSIDNLSAAGVEYYKIVNPLDERTCPYCRGLANRVFAVSAAKAAILNFSQATNLDEASAAIPWIETLEAIESTPFGIPPFHWLCRCRVIRV